VKRGYHRAIGTAVGTCIALLVGGCAPPPGQTARPPTGDRRAVSPACQCRFSYPAAWYFRTAIGDTSQPQLALHSYDDANTDHRPVPTRFADIGLDWHPDPGGHLYQALTAPHALSLPGLSERRAPLVVAGFPAVSYAYWTAPPSAGGIYEQHMCISGRPRMISTTTSRSWPATRPDATWPARTLSSPASCARWSSGRNRPPDRGIRWGMGAGTGTPPQASPMPVDPGQVSLRDLRIIQFREGRDSEPRPLDAADTATVLRLLRADLAWLERAGRADDGGGA